MRSISAFVFSFAMSAMATSAIAHPHVWVVVRSELVFDPDGRISGVRQKWQFDEMYSAFAIQGLGKNGKPSQDELNALANVNVKQLSEYGYFSYLRASGKQVEYSGVKEATITLDDKKNVTLHFTAVLKQPASARKAVVLQVYDPDYFVAFDFAKESPVAMTNAPPGCSLRMVQPKPLSDADTKRLQASAGTNDSPGSDMGAKLAPRAFVACP